MPSDSSSRGHKKVLKVSYFIIVYEKKQGGEQALTSHLCLVNKQIIRKKDIKDLIFHNGVRGNQVCENTSTSRPTYSML